jgi:hypothetical protein
MELKRIRAYNQRLYEQNRTIPRTLRKTIGRVYDALFGGHHGHQKAWTRKDGSRQLEGSDAFISKLFGSILHDIEALREHWEAWSESAPEEDYELFLEDSEEARALLEGLSLPPGKHGLPEPADKLGYVLNDTPRNIAILAASETLSKVFKMDYTPATVTKKIAKYPA